MDLVTGAPSPPAAHERDGAHDGRQAPLAALDQVVRDLKEYEGAAELSRTHYEAHLDASAARARSAALDSALARARESGTAFDVALARVYRDPAQAQYYFATVAREMGTTAAVQTLRERPEALGPLRSVERRVYGFSLSSDGQARSAARRAAAVGREWAEHTRAFRRVAADARAGRLEYSFARALEDLYQDPSAARSQFKRLASERGANEAAQELSATPITLGELLPGRERHRPETNALSLAAAELGAAALEARAQTRLTDPRGPGWQLDAEPAASRVTAQSAARHEAAARAKLGMLARGREELARGLSATLSRLTPDEIRQLHTALTAPQIALMAQLKQVGKDFVLGRSEGRER